jgi:hypothetical protein
MEPFMKKLTYRLVFALCASLLLTAAQAALPTQQLDQLAAPVALYPDALLAQVLAASTYPDEVADAAAWLRQNSGLNAAQLAQAVDAQPWDPSVKALTQFPSVLANMNQNRSWTSALGEAYTSEPGAVMQEIQVLRQRAQAAGALRSTTQQSVTTQDGTIAIEPANPTVVYVPAYDPWLVYGTPILAYPGWAAVPGMYYAGPGLYWGPGFDIGLFAGFGWGWHHWGFDWHRHALLHDHAPWRPHSAAFGHVGPAFHGEAPHFKPQPQFEGHGGFVHEGGFHSEAPRVEPHSEGHGGFAHEGGFHGGGGHR